MIKNLPASAGDTGSIPGLERPPGGGRGSLLQYSRLEDPMDRGAWRTAAVGVTTEHARVCTHTHTHTHTHNEDIIRKLEHRIAWIHPKCNTEK